MSSPLGREIEKLLEYILTKDTFGDYAHLYFLRLGGRTEANFTYDPLKDVLIYKGWNRSIYTHDSNTSDLILVEYPISEVGYNVKEVLLREALLFAEKDYANIELLERKKKIETYLNICLYGKAVSFIKDTD